MQGSSKKICYLVTEDWYFLSHRLQLAKAAQRDGYDVYVITRINKGKKLIESEGIQLIPIDMNRHGKNIFKEILLIVHIIKIYKNIKPDIIHHIALKPTLYGTLASIFLKVPKIVNTVAGLGYIFNSSSSGDRLLSTVIKYTLKLSVYFKSPEFITQNPEDSDFLVRNNITKKNNVHLIRGSGVDPELYKPAKYDREIPTILFASRLLWSKGVKDYVSAAEIIGNKNIPSVFLLAGEPDPENPDSVSILQLDEWNNSGFISYIGQQNNMPELLSEIDIVCLPTYYGEGVPKILIEAASCAIPLITTDIAGCREIVEHGINGYLVPVRDPAAVATMIETLLLDVGLRKKMGSEGRRIVKEGFSMDKVNAGTIKIYNNLLHRSC